MDAPPFAPSAFEEVSAFDAPAEEPFTTELFPASDTAAFEPVAVEAPPFTETQDADPAAAPHEALDFSPDAFPADPFAPETVAHPDFAEDAFTENNDMPQELVEALDQMDIMLIPEVDGEFAKFVTPPVQAIANARFAARVAEEDSYYWAARFDELDKVVEELKQKENSHGVSQE